MRVGAGGSSSDVNKDVNLTKISIKNGAMQKVPFELRVGDSTQMSNLEWYLNGQPVSLPHTIDKEGMYTLTGKNAATDETISVHVNAISPVIVSSFEVTPDSNKYEYIYQNKNSSLSGVSLFVPKGAVNKKTTIKVKESNVFNIPNTDGVAISKLLTLEPSGLQLDKPIVIHLPYEGDVDPQNIVIASYSDGGVVEINRPHFVDEKNKEVVFSTSHFTEFVLQKVSLTFIDKRKSEQTEIQVIETLLGITKYTNDEWHQILNESIDGKDSTVYDLIIEYLNLNEMSSNIPGNYAKAVKKVFPKSSSALQQQIKTIESVSNTMKYVDIFASGAISFKPQGFSSALASTTDKVKLILPTFASLIGLPTSVNDLGKVDTYKPDFVVNTLGNQFNKIDNVFYQKLWGEFNSAFNSGADEDVFMDSVFTPQNDLLLDLMEDSVINGVKLKALLTREMIHNLKFVYLRHKNFKENKGLLLDNIKKIVGHVYNADSKKIAVIPENHNNYYINSKFIPSILFQASGYGSEGFKAQNPKLVLNYEGHIYTFNKEDFIPYSYGVNGMFLDESTDNSISEFTLSKTIQIPAQPKNVQMSYKYTDDSGVVKNGIYYLKYISPKKDSIVAYDYDLREYDLKYNKSIYFYPTFKNNSFRFIDYTAAVTLGGRTDNNISGYGGFVLSDSYYEALNDQDSASQSDLEALANLKVTFSSKRGSRYTFDSKSFTLNLVELWNSLEEQERKIDWSNVDLRYSGASSVVSTTDDITLLFYDRLVRRENIEPKRLDIDGDGIYDQKLSNGNSITFKFPATGIKGPSCVEFQHKTGQETKRICTSVRLTLKNGQVQENTRPISKAQVIALSNGQKTNIDLFGYDSDGDKLSYRISTNPKYGSIISIEGNKVVYDPGLSFYSNDDFSDGFNYIVNDGVVDSRSKFIRIKKGEPVTVPPTPNDTILKLSGKTVLEEGESANISTGLQGSATRVKCTTSTASGVFDLSSYGGTLSNDKTNVYIKAPRFSDIPQFTLTCKASSTIILATDSIVILVTKKTVEPPENPTVKLPSDQTFTDGQKHSFILKPVSVTDEDVTTLTYAWSVTWTGKQGSTGSAISNDSFNVEIPSLQVGESGSVLITLTVTDIEGKSASDSVRYNYNLAKVEALEFVSDNFTDGSTLNRGSSQTLTWTIKNAGNVDLTNVQLKLSSEIADKLVVSSISPASIADWPKGVSKTFTVTVDVPKTVIAGTHKQVWNFYYGSNQPLPYIGKTAAAPLFFIFKTTNPNDFVGRFILDKKVVKPGQTVTGLLEINSGNDPYKVTVDWGDGTTPVVYADVPKNTATGMTQSSSHSYASDGTYNITVKVVDNADKQATYTDVIKVSTLDVSSTDWQADIHDIVTNELVINYPFTVTSKTASGNAYEEYSTDWDPSFDPTSKEYFVKYRLPVPAGLLTLDKKLHFTVVSRASAIPAYDREINIRTSNQKEYTASVRHIGFKDELPDGTPITGGYFTTKDLSTGDIVKQAAPFLQDNAGSLGQSSYVLETNPNTGVLGIYNSQNTELFTKNIALGNNYITELNATFKGNGKLELALLEYDLNGDGEFTANEKLVLNTHDKSVDWSPFLSISPPPLLATGKLNDTGITQCADNISNNLACPVSTHPNQDAQIGRDATHNDDSDGHAGFSFTKISSTGAGLPASATEWSCVKDNVTGLIWEVKTDDGGLHDKNNTYTWYNPDNSTNGGSAGTENGDNDTDSFVVNTNAIGLCGANDWRLPAREELRSLVDYGVVNPVIDTTYFPNTVSTWYWSSSPDANYSGLAWIVNFSNGDGSTYYKYNDSHVRLVRSGQ